MKRKPQRLPAGTPTVSIEKLSHEVRGIGHLDGKTLFVDNSLPGETVKLQYTSVRSRFDEGVAIEILKASPDRVAETCQHASECGGCALQHMDSAAQIREKQQILLDQLQRFASITEFEVLPPLTATPFGYRRKARLGVQYSTRRGQKNKAKRGLQFGFRAKRSNELINLNECPIMAGEFATHIPRLRELINECEGRADISHIEVAIGEDATALVVRHLKTLSPADINHWLAFCQQTNFHLYFQPDSAESAHKLWPQDDCERLTYQLPEFDLEMRFHPLDFIQVNFEINRQMVTRAVELLDLQPGERVLDLFCGLGNFTLPLARRTGENGEVVGIEGDASLIQRGKENAQHNGLSNVQFFAADLTESITTRPWAKRGFDKILLDPPRTGALEVVRELARFKASKLVYVSCNPATLARDAAELGKLGYRLSKAGVMDMFPQTTHVESIALFEREK